MTFLKNRQFTSLVLLAFLPLTLSANRDQQAADAVIARAISDSDRLIDEGQRQLSKIRVCLSSIMALLKKDKSYTPEKLALIGSHFMYLDQTIAKLMQEKFVKADTTDAYSLLQFNSILIDHIYSLIQHDFNNVATCNIQKILVRTLATSTDKSPTLKQIAQQLIINNNKLDRLTKKSLGLRWYNNIVRYFDQHVIDPCQKYSIPRRALLAAGTLFAATLAVHRFDPKLLENACSKVGIKPVYDTWFGEPYEPIKPLMLPNEALESPTVSINPVEPRYGYFSKADRLLYAYFGKISYLCSGVFGLVGVGLAGEAKSLYPHLKKYAIVLKNWLKGGGYLKEAERISKQDEHVRFKDIFGQDEIKRYLQLLVDYLEDPETFDRLGLTPPKGILCMGDTRTGKTFCVNALFGEINDMLKRTGQSSKYGLIKLDALTIKLEGMDTILKNIQQFAPCIIFIDEIDLLYLQRTGENRTLSEFLTSMGDAIASKDSKKQVIVIAATNRPETLDVALRQPGRFGKELRFEYPNFQDRCGFLKTKLEELSLNSSDIDITKLAQYTANKSYEALSMLIKNAIIKSRLRGEPISQQILDETLDEDIYHIIPHYTKEVPQAEQQILAAHFAGQTLVLTLLHGAVKLSKVTIKQVMTELKEEAMWMRLCYKDQKEQQRFEYGKIFVCYERDSIDMSTREEKLNLCKMYLAGFIAEELLLQSCGYSCHAETDTRTALSLAQSIAFEGHDIKELPKHIQNQKHNEALAIVEQCKKEVREMLVTRQDTLRQLSQALLDCKTLNNEQVQKIVKGMANSGQATA